MADRENNKNKATYLSLLVRPPGAQPGRHPSGCLEALGQEARLLKPANKAAPIDKVRQSQSPASACGTPRDDVVRIPGASRASLAES